VVYLDSNVFIYPLIYDLDAEPKAKASRNLLSDVVNGRVRGVTSTLTWDEVVWVVWKVIGYDEAVRAGAALLTLPNTDFMDVTPLTLMKAQGLIDKYGLKPRDSIHVATAILAKEPEVVSDDEELDVVKEIRRVPLV